MTLWGLCLLSMILQSPRVLKIRVDLEGYAFYLRGTPEDEVRISGVPVDSSWTGDTLVLSLRGTTRGILSLFGIATRSVTVKVPEFWPLDLDLTLRGGRAELRLEEVALRHLSVQASRARIWMRMGPSPFDTLLWSGDLTVSLGKLEIEGLGGHVPKDLWISLSASKATLKWGTYPTPSPKFPLSIQATFSTVELFPGSVPIRVLRWGIGAWVSAGSPTVTEGSTVLFHGTLSRLIVKP